MPHAAITIIRNEHAALSAMLRTLLMLLEQHRRHHTLPPFDIVRAMLFYVDEFPERLHHAKESELLFPKLRARSLQSREVLDRLDRDHARGERAIRDLEHSLLGFEMMAGTAQLDSRRNRFEEAARHYVEFYLDHMRVEETIVLPLAEQVLTEEDWIDIDAAFEANRDPLAGHAPDAEYAPLFSRIVALLPAPLGLGTAPAAA
jgi:hemerythrin-like domain-containing protein